MGNNNRNKPCWCGSGKKFKKCHLNRDSQDSLTRGDLEQYSKKQNSKKVCSVSNLFPDKCSKKIINAHTVSKSGSLKELSEKGHVMGAKPSLSGFIKNNGKLTLEKVGINRASTFTGFCSVHDKEIFSPLEDEPIVLNDQQLFLLAYRGMCREIFHKEQNKGTANLMREADRGQDEFLQHALQGQASLYDQGVDLALRDLQYLKSEMDSILLDQDYSKIRHYVFELSEVPKIQVSAMVVPEMDFHGNPLQKLGLQQYKYDYIFFNCISYEGRGCFVFSWLTEDDKHCSKFIASLLELDDHEIADALVRFCYSFSENTWASPSWWDSLDSSSQQSITERLLQGTPMAAHPEDCLMDDGHSYGALKISKKELR
ncbi:SEC-C domain-containing protein [Pontibacterium granulatum]|uniref:SEC-C domain-containing protein n=1 Tax=Pontibacterium granulatum TaxID=2036029 RepID=UPI00249AAB8F|nr:SEC-C domain-containing protein [Pontibacterium granulatum]MDI3326406.1 SEC-C domain-containing protein [Pontibacterium granulatum]